MISELAVGLGMRLSEGTLRVGAEPRTHEKYPSWRSDLNRRPAVYETAALPLSYASTSMFSNN